MKKRKRRAAVLLTVTLLVPFCMGCGDKREFGIKSVGDVDVAERIVAALAVDISPQGYTVQKTSICGDQNLSFPFSEESTDKPVKSLHEEATPIPVGYSYNGTVFEYNGVSYEMTERYDGITAIMNCFLKGEYIIIEGHTGSHNGVYSIFNTKTQKFETDLFGHHLMFCGEDIHTAVYAFWNDICLYDGTVLASLNLEPEEMIRQISFNKEEKRLEVEVLIDDNKSYVEFIDISENLELF